jgi:signal transduction histidine kinase
VQIAANESPPAWSDVRRGILKRYLDLLAASGSPLLDAGDAVQAQLHAQLYSVIDEASLDSPAPVPGSPQLSTAIGRDRAASGIHPSASLAAANMIFAAALTDLAAHLEREGVPSPLETAALRLNAAILRRMAEAAANYVSYLLEKAGTAHREEARRLSRELHDAVGPIVAINIQNLDLIEHWSGTDPDKAQQKIEDSRRTLREAMSLIRSLAAETRLTVEPHEICEALRSHLASLPASIRTELRATDDLTGLPPHYGNEIFLILREAARNAVAHGDPTELVIDISVAGATLTATVRNDGRGFDPTAADSPGTGVSSMRERAALIGATLNLTSTPDATAVTLVVPLPGRMGS